MKKTALSFIGFLCTSLIIAQKPAFDTSAPIGFYQWPTIFDPTISNDGNYVSYMIRNVPAPDSSMLIVESTDLQWKQEFLSAERASITSDCRRVIFKNKGGGISLVSLGSDEKNIIPDVESYALSGPENREEWLAYFRNSTFRKLFVRSLKSGQEFQFEDVMSYSFNKHGTVLIFQSKEKDRNNNSVKLHWFDLLTCKDIVIWEGDKCSAYCFDNSGQQMSFIAEVNGAPIPKREVWWYKDGINMAVMQVNDITTGIDSSLCIDGATPSFSHRGDRIFFQLVERPIRRPESNVVKVDVWNYKDLELQSSQVGSAYSTKSFMAVIHINGERVIQLQFSQERMVISHDGEGDNAIVVTEKDGWQDTWWDTAVNSTVYLESTIDGTRKILNKSLKERVIPELYELSPDDKWVIYFNKKTKSWWSYEIEFGISRDISSNIPVTMYNENSSDKPFVSPYFSLEPVGIAGWCDQGRLLVYDDYDIWQLDPKNTDKPKNITKSYGRRQRIKFRIAQSNIVNNLFKDGDTLILSAFSKSDKFNGLYRKILNTSSNLELLTMGPYVLCTVGSQLFNYSTSVYTPF